MRDKKTIISHLIPIKISLYEETLTEGPALRTAAVYKIENLTLFFLHGRLFALVDENRQVVFVPELHFLQLLTEAEILILKSLDYPIGSRIVNTPWDRLENFAFNLITK